MLRRLGWIIGLKGRESPAVVPVRDFKRVGAMLETVQEIAVYIHKFHNVDLLQQGWYQIRITMRWEDSEDATPGMPARVVQYEAPDMGADDVHGVWRIDDADNSFSTQPFRIKYIRQDVLLSVMVSFNLSLDKYEGPPTSAILLKFELFYTPILANESSLQASIEGPAASVHEFYIPPKALLGLHSYCPVHFDSFHAALVDVTIHITVLKAVVHQPFSKAKSHMASVGSSLIALVKTLLSAREVLLKELCRLSKAIDIEIDFTDYEKLFDDSTCVQSNFHKELETMKYETRLGNTQYEVENANGGMDVHSVEMLEWLSSYFSFVGNQMLYVWNLLLNFHRINRKKLLEFLRESWANDRRAEWSIWMVYSKVEMPHQYISSAVDDSSYHGSGRKGPILRKLTDDPAQASAMRADLHRRSIAQMRINNRSIQDMQIYGDPSRIPIVLIERVINSPLRTTSGNSYFSNLSYRDVPSLQGKSGLKSSRFSNNPSPSNNSQNTHVLKIVVFVHGFQGHHLDLRLVRNQWLLIDPKAEFLLSEANEGKTSEDFEVMGFRLAQEVIAFVKLKMDSFSKKFGVIGNIKLSFVGHSIGNLIIRAALSEGIMEPYLRHLYTYVSVSGPHLGYMYSSNSIFNSGLWLLKKFKNTQCIHQLTFTDDPDLRNTFLYKLCKQKTLDNFRNIILLSSPQDGYVPYHSARIEVCAASSADYSKKGKIFLEMLNECLDQIRTHSSEHRRIFMRCDVNFDVSSHGRNLNTFIGRAAHIEFLEADMFARFIMWSFPELFR
uniref:DUF676 domain-containing protein n=1 Tax=Kalanchoe fedtschenkoi TaxID=63787 RepID=A0A7N0TVR9_KALFE